MTIHSCLNDCTLHHTASSSSALRPPDDTSLLFIRRFKPAPLNLPRLFSLNRISLVPQNQTGLGENPLTVYFQGRRRQALVGPAPSITLQGIFLDPSQTAPVIKVVSQCLEWSPVMMLNYWSTVKVVLISKASIVLLYLSNVTSQSVDCCLVTVVMPTNQPLL